MKNKKVNVRENVKLFWGIAKQYKYSFMFIIFFVLIIALLKILDSYLLKLFIDYGNEFTAGTILADKYVQFLIVLSLVFIFSIFVKAISNWMQIHITNRLENKLIFEIKRKFFNHLIGLSHSFHTTHKTGSLISRLTRGTRSIEGLVDFFIFNGLPFFLNISIVSLAIYYFDKTSALILLIISILILIYSLFIINKNKIARLESNAAEDKEKGSLSDFFSNIDSIKFFGKESRVKHLFSKLIEDSKNKSLKAWDYYRWLEFGQVIILGVGLIAVLIFPLIQFLNGEISIGSLAFIYSVFGTFVDPLLGFVWGIRRFYESLADIQDLFEYDRIKNDIVDKSNAKDLKINEGSIEFKNVSFGYHNSREVIRNFNLKIHPHEKVAFVGHSGSGKTTIVKILYRLYDISSGIVLIDGKDIKDYKQESLRSELSIVPQECILFDDTIYSNILFSNPNASRKEVLNAIKFSQLDEFIQKLPKKEKTIVGERGVKLSGGEKQRVSIARALLANKKILVLDEATSSLDSKTESQIQQELDILMKGRTSLIIAHRLSTIMKADRIVVLNEGRIVQIGKHEELIKQKGIYRELWNLQKGGYIK